MIEAIPAMQQQTIDQLEATSKAEPKSQQNSAPGAGSGGGGGGKLLLTLVIGVLCVGGVAAGVFFVKPQSALSDIWNDVLDDATTAMHGNESFSETEQTTSHHRGDRDDSVQVDRLKGQLASMYDEMNNLKRQLAIVTSERDEALSQAHLLNQVVRPSEVHRQAKSGRTHESMARDMSVRRAYGPLVRPGRYAFGSEGKHPTHRPASFSALRDQGVTREFNRFVNAMTGRGYYRDNDRMPFYQIPSTPDETELMESLFEEFGNLGPVWVQMGVLRP